jgi:CDP-diacylglycerol--serine O-phosphatidyltransferase
MIRRLNLPANLKAVPGKRQPRAAYALPTFFTAVNMFLGYTAILKSYAGVVKLSNGALGPSPEFEQAAIMIGVAVLTDGIDGRVARMTNTVSDFGREMDSLADAITFGLAPAVLAFAWGVQFVDPSGHALFRGHLLQIGYFISFLFMLCGASRLARFNVTTNPIPKNPGRPDRKYFVGLPIPAAAGFVAAIVYASHSVVDSERTLARVAGAARVPHGQHVALSQLQRSQFAAASFAAFYHFCCELYLSGGRLFEDSLRNDGGPLRR